MAALVRNCRLVIDGPNVNLKLGRKTSRMNGESICSIIRVVERGDKFLVLVSTEGVMKLPDYFATSLAEIEEDLRSFCPTEELDDFVDEERRRIQGERSVCKEGPIIPHSNGVVSLVMSVIIAALLSVTGFFLQGLPEPFSSLAGIFPIFGGFFMVVGYMGWRCMGGSPKRSFTLLTRETLVVRGQHIVILHVPSIVEVRPSAQGSQGRKLRVMTRDGKHVLLDDVDLELPLKEFADLTPPGWVDPTVSFTEAWEMLGRLKWRHFWRLLNGDVTTVRKYGVTRYLRSDVEALKVRLGQTS